MKQKKWKIVIKKVILGLVIGATGYCCAIFLLFKIWIYSLLFKEITTWGIYGLLTGLYGALGFTLSIASILLMVFALIRYVFNEKSLIEHMIYPFPMRLSMEEISTPLASKVFLRVDDEFLIINNAGDRKWPLFFGGVFMLITGSLCIYSIFSREFGRVASIFLPIFLGSTFAFLYGLIHPTKIFVFDRLKGTVTIPGPLFFKNVEIPFEKVKVGQFRGSLTFLHPTIGINIMVYGEYCASDWSFYVQYMDRFRPLLKGSAFDPYREKDFKRRQSLGFPKPIYYCDFVLNDATSGYIFGTADFKEKLAHFKVDISDGHLAIGFWFYHRNYRLNNDNDLVLIGIWQAKYVFRLFAPENQEYFVFDDNDVPDDCLLVHGHTKKVTYVPKRLSVESMPLSPAFLQVMTALKFDVSAAISRLLLYLADNKQFIENPNRISILGISDKYYILGLDTPQPNVCDVLAHEQVPSGCYWVHGNTKQVIPPDSKT